MLIFAQIRRLICLIAAVTAATAVSGQTLSFNVFARNNSTATVSNDISPPATALNTGLSFVQGATLNVTASGSWNIGGGQPSFGPDGIAVFGNGLPGVLYGTLIGKVAPTGEWNTGTGWFKIGSNFAGVAPSSGTLFMAFLDQDAANNSGFVTAVVGVPETSTYLLMLAGVTILSWDARRRPH